MYLVLKPTLMRSRNRSWFLLASWSAASCISARSSTFSQITPIRTRKLSLPWWQLVQSKWHESCSKFDEMRNKSRFFHPPCHRRLIKVIFCNHTCELASFTGKSEFNANRHKSIIFETILPSTNSSICLFYKYPHSFFSPAEGQQYLPELHCSASASFWRLQSQTGGRSHRLAFAPQPSWLSPLNSLKHMKIEPVTLLPGQTIFQFPLFTMGHLISGMGERCSRFLHNTAHESKEKFDRVNWDSFLSNYD